MVMSEYAAGWEPVSDGRPASLGAGGRDRYGAAGGRDGPPGRAGGTLGADSVPIVSRTSVHRVIMLDRQRSNLFDVEVP